MQVFLKTNTFTQTVYGRGKKLSTPRRQNIKKSFILRENKKQKKKNKDRIEIFEYFLKQKKKKKRKKKPEHNERLIKDKIIRDIRSLCEQEEEYYKPKKVSNFLIIILNVKVTVIKTATFH